MQDKIFPDGLPKSPLARLKESGKPILLYGMGDGGEKVAALLADSGIPLSGVFATDGFKNERTFLGFPLFPAGELAARYPGGATALVAFGCADADMRMYLGRLRRQTIDALMPHLPLFGGALFDADYYDAHREELIRVYDALADDGSRALLRALLSYMLTWEPETLFRAPTNQDAAEAVFASLRPKKAVDGGAYNGDTALRFSALFPSLRELIAFEPDPKNYEKLSATVLLHGKLTALPYGLWSEDGTLSFDASHNRGAHFTPGFGEVPVRALDAMPECGDADFIKLDVEGCETEALAGAKNLLDSKRAAWQVSIYHKTDDLITLPLLFAAHGYRIHLYREPVCPAWDIQLLAIPQ